MFILYYGKFPGAATWMVNEEAWPAGATTGLIPWELPFHFLLFKNAYEPPKTTWMGLGHFLLEIGKCPPNSHLNPAIVIDVLDERLNCI